ncbi:MAG: hypothetical protein ACK53W_00085 [Gemmatimonadota bacterium]
MRLVVAELEDVIASTAHVRADALAVACAALGLPPPPDRVQGAGLGVDDAAAIVARAVAPDDATLPTLLALAAEREAASRLARESRLSPGALAFVAACAAEGRFGIVTRARRAVAESLVAAAGLEEGLAFLWCADDRARDGAPAVARAIAAQRPFGPRRAAVLADRADWLATGAAAGARTVAIPAAPPDVTPDATWLNFQDRVPSDLDGPG